MPSFPHPLIGFCRACREDGRDTRGLRLRLEKNAGGLAAPWGSHTGPFRRSPGNVMPAVRKPPGRSLEGASGTVAPAGGDTQILAQARLAGHWRTAGPAPRARR